MAPTALLLLVVERTGDLRPAAVCSLLRSWAMAMPTSFFALVLLAVGDGGSERSVRFVLCGAWLRKDSAQSRFVLHFGRFTRGKDGSTRMTAGARRVGRVLGDRGGVRMGKKWCERVGRWS